MNPKNLPTRNPTLESRYHNTYSFSNLFLKIGQSAPNSAKCQPKCAKADEISAVNRQSQAKSRSKWPRSANYQLWSTKFDQMLANVEVGQMLAEVCQVQPKCAKVTRMSAKVREEWPNFGQMSAKFDFTLKVDHMSAKAEAARNGLKVTLGLRRLHLSEILLIFPENSRTLNYLNI